jgi:type IV secretory pathway TraG/TraD family ATPase VirD4
VVDELSVLGRQAKLETLVTRGRKRGLAAVLGFQSIAQLRRIYGHEEAAVLASMPSTKLLLRVDEPETAAFIARQIGEREALREEIGISTAEHGNRYNLHPARRTEPVVMASEVQRWPKLEGYLCIAGLDRARVKVKPCVPRSGSSVIGSAAALRRWDFPARWRPMTSAPYCAGFVPRP